MRRWLFVLILMIFAGTTLYHESFAQDVESEIIKSGVWQGFPLERIRLKARDGETIPAIFLYPKGKGQFPTVFLLHGLTDNKDGWLEFSNFQKGGDLTECLLDNGYAVLAIDMRLHGERSQGRTREQISSAVIGNIDFFFDDTLNDIFVGMDYLASHPRVSKIGMLGYSLGGVMTFAAANRDERVKTAVTCVSPTFIGNIATAPSSNMRNIKNIPWLMIMATKDTYYTQDRAQWLYDLLPTNPKKLIFFDSGHSLPVQYVDEATEWFKMHLKS